MDAAEEAQELSRSSNDKDEVEKEIKPVLGMTFSSYEEAKDFYNRHAMQKGFDTKVKSSSINKQTKEKNYVMFTCSKEGFKDEKKVVLYRRSNIRVGCKAHLRVRLTDSKKWKVVSFDLEHNHSCSPFKSRRFRSRKDMVSNTKRRLELNCNATIPPSKLYHNIAIEVGVHENVTFGQKEARNYIDKNQQAMHMFFTHMQQKNPDFFYLVDLDSEGHARNVFWADARSKTAYNYFGDVVTFDTTYLTNGYDLKLTLFVGANHHGNCVLFGCGLLTDETTESFVWVFRAWLTAMSGLHPIAIITDQCKEIGNAVVEVFPKSRHRLCLWHIMKNVSGKLDSLIEYKEVKRLMKNAVYNFLRINEFEEAWAHMIETYHLQDNIWLATLYNLRQQWVPVYLKDTFFAGMSTSQHNETVNVFFDGYVHAKTSLKEFVDKYELALEDKYEKESKADFDSFNVDPSLKTSSLFERQVAKVYTRDMFLKFQEEVYGFVSCSKSQLRADGHITTYAVKERLLDKNGNLLTPRVYEVSFNNDGAEVFCICRLFQYKGILCKHALCVLNEFVDEIPSQYILPRWRKDFKHRYINNRVFANVEVKNPAQRYEVLYPYAFQILKEGLLSDSKFKIVLDGLRDIQKKVLDINDGSCDRNNEESIQPENVNFQDPLQAKGSGRPQKRLVSSSEKNLEAYTEKDGGKMESEPFGPREFP